MAGAPDATMAAGLDAAGDAMTATVALLSAALAHVDKVGLDNIVTSDEAMYKKRNKQLKAELQQVLGVDQMSEFKEFSARFRRAVSSETRAALERREREPEVRTYAMQVLSVFTAACDGDMDPTTISSLLGDLVILLPDEALRHSLHQSMTDLRDCGWQCADVVADTAPTSGVAPAVAADAESTPHDVRDQPAASSPFCVSAAPASSSSKTSRRSRREKLAPPANERTFASNRGQHRGGHLADVAEC